MSYTIVYDSVFIKSPNGYTVCVLAGDNNVYETDKKEHEIGSAGISISRKPKFVPIMKGLQAEYIKNTLCVTANG